MRLTVQRHAERDKCHDRQHVPTRLALGPAQEARLGSSAAVASLAVSLVGVTVFGSFVAEVGDWAQGREFETVAAWALPGLGLAVLAGLAAVRALFVRRGHGIALVLSLLVALSLVSMLLVNPPIAPPVP